VKKTTFAIVLFCFPAITVYAQGIGKSLAFAQIAAGGSLESILNLTNRGTTTYTGSFNLFTMTDGNPAHPGARS